MNERQRCPNCGQHYHPVDVHGHVQCSVCKVNIDPCCGGEACDRLSALFAEPDPAAAGQQQPS